jgi:hypothetical protein
MRRIDDLHLEYPFMGSHMLRDRLNPQGIRVGRREIYSNKRGTSIADQNSVSADIGCPK